MKMFDYIYYRVCDYYKRKSDSTAEAAASSLISIIQCLLIVDFFLLVRVFWEYPIPENFNKYWGLPIFVIIAIINWRKYEKSRKYRKLRLIWKDEDNLQRKKSGLMIVIFILCLIFIPVVYGVIRQNIMGGKSFLG